MGAAFDLNAVGNAMAEAAADPARWDAAMDMAADATGSFGAMLFDAKGHLPGIPKSRRMGPSLEAYVKDGWIDRDDRYNLLPLMVRRGAVSELDVLTPEEIARHPYHQEFLAPFGLRWFAGVKVAAGDDLWCLSIQRSIQQGPFSPSEMQSLADFPKQLGSAVALARMLSFARAEGAMGAFSASGTPAVMLDRNAAVIVVNEPAERLFGRDLWVTGRHLACADRNATDALRCAFHVLLRNPNPPSNGEPRPAAPPRRQTSASLSTRLPRITTNVFASCQIVVCFIDPDIHPHPSEVALRTCFGLSPAEVRLARRVSSGRRMVGRRG